MPTWYRLVKKSQVNQQQVLRDYQNLERQLGQVSITGNGANQTVSIMGESVQVRPLLEQAVAILRPVISQKGVREINTDPLPDSNIQGLAVSVEPGMVHVDVARIVHGFQTSLPPTVETDGIEPDPDIKKSIVEEISKEILRELGGTISHESAHMDDFWGQFKNWSKNPQSAPGPQFNLVQEAPGPRFEAQVKQQFFQ